MGVNQLHQHLFSQHGSAGRNRPTSLLHVPISLPLTAGKYQIPAGLAVIQPDYCRLRKALQLLRVSNSDVQPATLQEEGSHSTAAEVAVQDSEAINMQQPSFAGLGIHDLLLDGLQRNGLTAPSPIQAVAIPKIASGLNCAVQSYTGSGKTLTYLLPVLSKAIAAADTLRQRKAADLPVQALVVAPSQELAMQIVRVAQSLLPDSARKAIQQCIGGANGWRQAEALTNNKPLMVVGTPGRLADMVRSGTLRLHQCSTLVLDEADQLLAPVFSEDMASLTDHCGKRVEGGRQTVLVSATLTESVLLKSAKWCPNPKYLSVGDAPTAVQEQQVDVPGSLAAPLGAPAPSWGWGPTGWDGPASDLAPKTLASAGGVEQDDLVPTMPPNLKHYYVVMQPQHRVDMLRRLVYALDAQCSLVFMNFQARLKDTEFKLKARGMEVASLHGDLSKLSRQNILNSFRRNQLRALIVNDVVARGLDVPATDAVFNLELPSSAAHYAHRAGRTGRMGAPGTVVSIISPGDRFVVDKLAAKLGVPILEAHVSYGELLLGAPASYSWEEDQAVEIKAKNSKKATLPQTPSSATKKAQLVDSSSRTDAVVPQPQLASNNASTPVETDYGTPKQNRTSNQTEPPALTPAATAASETTQSSSLQSASAASASAHSSSARPSAEDARAKLASAFATAFSLDDPMPSTRTSNTASAHTTSPKQASSSASSAKTRSADKPTNQSVISPQNSQHRGSQSIHSKRQQQLENEDVINGDEEEELIAAPGRQSKKSKSESVVKLPAQQQDVDSDSDAEDEEDGWIVSDEDLEVALKAAQLMASKRKRAGGLGKVSSFQSASTSSRAKGKSSSHGPAGRKTSLVGEVEKELAEIRAEKARLKKERYAAKKQLEGLAR